MCRRFDRPSAATKELAKQIPEARSRSARARSAAEIKSSKIEMNVAGTRRAWHSARARSFKSELIVHLPLLGVRQHVIGFLHLLEFFFRRFVARVQVRMIFAREFPVCLPDFLLRGLAGDAEKFVVVLFGGCGHKESVTSD